MKIEKLIYHVKPPCYKCPYTLGQVHTLRNPCSECKTNGYQMYERLLKERSGQAEFNSKEKRCW